MRALPGLSASSGSTLAEIAFLLLLIVAAHWGHFG